MAESSQVESETEVQKDSMEEQMDSSSHPEIDCENTLKPEVFKDSLKTMKSPLDSNLDITENCVEMEAEKRAPPVDTQNSESEIVEPASVDITDTQVEVNCTESALAQSENTVPENVKLDSKADILNTDVVNEETSVTITEILATGTETSVSEDVEHLTETSEQKSSDIPEPAIPDGDDCDNHESRSEIPVIPKEKVDESPTLPMDITDADKKDDQKNKNDPSDPKAVYRETIDITDSDSCSEDSESDSNSEDSDSSSVSSLSSPSKSDCESDHGECAPVLRKNQKGNYPVIKAKGELLPEDLPPIEELHITVPSSLCAEIGVVTSIVKTLVVIQSLKGVPALDLDSVLFLDNGSRTLGMVFDVFGPVTEPLYCVRFNSAEHIAEFNVKPGDQVYYAPETEHSKYVFLQQLMRMKGSDASRKFDLERGLQVDFSDDEEERKAYKKHGDAITAEVEGDDPDQLKRKRDANEVMEKKKKFAPHSQRGGFGGQQPAARGRPAYRRQQFPPRPRHDGPIHPPSFNYPPPSIPSTSAQRPNPPAAESTYSGYTMPQGAYNNQPYQNPMQQNTSFGQLPYALPQVDPRFFQFEARYTPMICNIPNPTPSVPHNVPPPAAPSFTVPYNQPLYSGSQSSYNSFYRPPTQNPPTYSAPPFNAPPPMTYPPPTNQSLFSAQPNTLPNQNAPFGGQYGSTYPNYSNLR